MDVAAARVFSCCVPATALTGSQNCAIMVGFCQFSEACCCFFVETFGKPLTILRKIAGNRT